MIEVLVEVGSGAARSRLVVRDESIRRVVELVKVYYPGARVVRPVELEVFFVWDAAALIGLFRPALPYYDDS